MKSGNAHWFDCLKESVTMIYAARTSWMAFSTGFSLFGRLFHSFLAGRHAAAG